MASDTKANHKDKDEESNDSKGRKIGSRSSSSLGTMSDTPGLRRSARDTSLKKKFTPSPSSTWKRERLEKCPPTTPTVMRKSERLIEKTILSSPFRRSLRGAKKQSLSSSSDSKKSTKSSGSSAMEKEHKKEKNLKQLEMKEVGNSDKHATEALLVEAKRMDARAYRALLKRQPKKTNLEGRCEEIKKKNTNGNDQRDDGSENVDGNDDTVALLSHKTLSELENNVAETEQKNLQAETPGLDTEVVGGYKVGLMAFKQKRSFDDMNSDATRIMVSNKDSDAAPHECDRTDSVEKCATSSKRQRGNHQSNPEEHFSCNPNLNEDSCDSSVPKGRGRIEANDTAGLAEQCITDLQHKNLCEILQFPENVKVMVERFLDYVLNNHHIVTEPASVLQAFLISLCWTAASMLKHKLDHKESLARAKQHLNFDCTKDEADSVYSKLRCLKKVFLYSIGASKVAASPRTGEFSNEVLSKNQSNGKSSLSTPSNMKKVRIEVENLRPSQEFSVDQVLSHLGLAQKDYTKSMEDIKKKCDKQMRKLLQKQQEERKELKRKYEEEKADIENMHRTEAAVIRLHSNINVRTDELKFLNSQYAKEFEKLNEKMNICLTTLLDSQLVLRKNLEKKAALWIEEVNSWVHAELINKSPVNESGFNQEIASKEQTPERSTPDGDVPPEVPKIVSSNEDVLPGVVATSERKSDGAASSMLDREVLLEVSKAASVREVSEDVVYVNSDSDVDVDVVYVNSDSDGHVISRVAETNSSSDGPERESPLEVTGILSSTGALENVAALNLSPNQHGEVDPSVVSDTPCEVGRSGNTDRENSGVCVAAVSYCTGVDQLSGVLPSGGLETATSADVGCGHTWQEIDRTYGALYVNSDSDEHVISRVPETNSSSDGPERESPLEVTGILSSTGALENVAALNLSLNQHGEVDPSVVCDTPCEVGGSGNTDRENGGVCVAAVSYCTGVDQLAGVLPSGGLETATSADVGCGHTWQEIDRTYGASSDNNQPANQHVVQMPVFMSQDPLQNELDRIRKETVQIIKMHEDSKLKHKSAWEMEIHEAIAEIHRKHDIKLQEMESEFLLKKNEMDENQNKVLMNQLLAEAFRTKCMDNKASTLVRQHL